MHNEPVTTFVVVCRLLLAATFLISGVAKLLDRPATRTATAAFGIPDPLVPLVAVALPAAELLTVVLLAGPPAVSRTGALVAVTMLIVFTALIARILLTGREVECRCFGALSDKPLGASSIVRNVVLAGLSAAVLLAPARHRGASLVGWFSDTPGPKIATALVLVLLSAVCLSLVQLFLALMKRHGAVLLRLEALEAGTPTTWRLPRPMPAPAVSLPTLAGGEASLEALTSATGRQHLLVIFMADNCAPCEQLAFTLPALRKKYGDELPVAVVATGTPDSILEKFRGVPDFPVLVTPGISEQLAYGVTGTPAAVVLADGQVLSAPAGGSEEIEELWRLAAAELAGLPVAPAPQLHQVKVRPRSVGESVSDLSVTHADGASHPLGTALAGEGKTLLYWDSACVFCHNLAAELTVDSFDPSAVLVISRDAVGTPLSFAGQVLYVDANVADALALPGTPSAVRVNAQGLLSSPIAAGGPNVLEMLNR